MQRHAAQRVLLESQVRYNRPQWELNIIGLWGPVIKGDSVVKTGAGQVQLVEVGWVGYLDVVVL